MENDAEKVMGIDEEARTDNISLRIMVASNCTSHSQKGGKRKWMR